METLLIGVMFWISLKDWQEEGKLSECQPGLIRNTAGTKETGSSERKCLNGQVILKNPSSELISQVLEIVDDDNTYYDARILAGDALIRMLKNNRDGFEGNVNASVRKVAERLRATPAPPIFYNTLTKLYLEICLLER